MIIVCCNRHYKPKENRKENEKKTRIKLIFLRYWLLGFRLLCSLFFSVALVNELAANRLHEMRKRKVKIAFQKTMTTRMKKRFESQVLDLCWCEILYDCRHRLGQFGIDWEVIDKTGNLCKLRQDFFFRWLLTSHFGSKQSWEGKK